MSALWAGCGVHPVHAGERIVYSFKGGADGAGPTSALLVVGGTLYGTTFGGGTYNSGTVFAVTAAGTHTVLHSFGRGEDGKQPTGGLVDAGGTLYGATYEGGVDRLGTIYAVTFLGAETVLYSFKRGPGGDGANPVGGLASISGTLYGTTFAGGAHSGGTVFAVTTGGTEAVLHSFSISGAREQDGSRPEAGVIDVAGALYGTTLNGGDAGEDGTVFKLHPNENGRTLYVFGGNADGSNPAGPLLNFSGTLFGTTQGGGADCGPEFHGCGTAFMLTRQGVHQVLHSFGGGLQDGGFPTGGLIKVKNKFYGTTSLGGAHGCGTVFEMQAPAVAGGPWIERVVYSFKGGKDGDSPEGGVISIAGALYGTTQFGGEYGGGTVFELTP